MLTELRIENFAIITRLELEFGSGLIAFTGETGAGKSIILDALDALVGAKTDASMIRSGAEKALVEGVFSLPEGTREAVEAILTREDLLDEPGYLTLSREMRREGRTVARVNGRSVNLALLRELGSYLVDIHGQSEHLSLLNVRQHINLLDRYAGSEPLLVAYRQVYHQLQKVRRELNELRLSEQDAARRVDLLTFQTQEIDAAHLLVGEEEELRQERDRLANAENLAAQAQQALQALDEGSSETPGISDLIGQVTQALAGISRIDPSQAELYEQALALAETAGEISRELQDYLEQIEFNPRRLEQVEERLDLIHRLKRKYGSSIEAVLAFGKDAQEKLDQITHSSERIAEMEAEEAKMLEKLGAAGAALSQQRKADAQQLALSVERELADLSMAGARFMVDIRHEADPNGVPLDGGRRLSFDETGFDRVEFLISPNPGEDLKPLVKIASGGETSRLMLALKNVLARPIMCLPWFSTRSTRASAGAWAAWWEKSCGSWVCATRCCASRTCRNWPPLGGSISTCASWCRKAVPPRAWSPWRERPAWTSWR
jgi:DNA repair protein RecN (Recombination protein N)